MKKNLALYFQWVSITCKAELQHRASFFLLAFSHFISTFVDIAGIWVLFDRFKIVKGWTLAELALLYGVVHMGFALAECFARGFDTFSQLIKNADFDRYLLRPTSTLLQVAAREVQLMRVGRFLQGFCVLFWGYHSLHLPLFSWQPLLLLLSILGTASLFYGLFILQATLSFWTIETLEIMNITTYGGVESAQYPLTFYPERFRLLLTLAIPFAYVAYYPVATAIQLENLPIALACMAPCAGLLFLFFSCLLWHWGVRHYRSAGH